MTIASSTVPQAARFIVFLSKTLGDVKALL
jgi:hypothetical protein